MIPFLLSRCPSQEPSAAICILRIPFAMPNNQETPPLPTSQSKRPSRSARKHPSSPITLASPFPGPTSELRSQGGLVRAREQVDVMIAPRRGTHDHAVRMERGGRDGRAAVLPQEAGVGLDARELLAVEVEHLYYMSRCTTAFITVSNTKSTNLAYESTLGAGEHRRCLGIRERLTQRTRADARGRSPS